ncbi:MAG: hypothetical protein KAH32_03780 [Chlamydiia bacterium]|nr:hypothetical protein [Chlamydiia bacterium]
MAHLSTRKWGSHIILDELYDSLLDHADTIAELLLARTEANITIPASDGKIDITKYLESFVKKSDDAKKAADEKGFNDISAEIDTLKITVMKALYKLKKLVAEKGVSADSLGHSEYMRGGGKINMTKPPLLKR